MVRCVWLLFILMMNVAQAKVMIWQPLNEDKSLSYPAIQARLTSIKQQGFDTLLVQWSQFGYERFQIYGTPEIWLQRLVRATVEADMKLIFGLYHDPEFFVHIQKEGKERQDLLALIRKRSLDQATNDYRYITQLPNFAGWYLPEEIDDMHWNTPLGRQTLSDHLKETVQSLKAITPNAPVFTSAFFSGHLPPKEYALWLAQLEAQTQLRILVQTGYGVGRLTLQEIKAYLDELFLPKPKIHGLVLETFQFSKGNVSVMSKSSWQQQLKLVTPYSPNLKVTFSQRYQ